jgi:hypothetical protein
VAGCTFGKSVHGSFPPLVDGLYAWMLTLRTATRPTSLLGQALTYAM